MNSRNVVSFFKSKLGALIIFLCLIAIAVVVAIRTKGLAKSFGRESKTQSSVRAIDPTQAQYDPTKPQLVETVAGNMVPFQVPEGVEPTPPPTPSPTPTPVRAEKQHALPPISLYTAAASADEPEPMSAEYAPFGRLLQCELVVTVDSSAIETPVIGLITADIWHGGKLIIPAGTEVHGMASLNRARERIAAQGAWTLVWQTGEELVVTGLALDREEGVDGEGWGLTDGSAGLRGQVIKTDDMTELKLFAASFLSAGANAFQDTETTVYGTRPDASVKNAALSGVSSVLNSYASQMLEAIRQDGMFVRVPAGKQFYLYVTQTLDRQDATVGNSRLNTPKLANKDGPPTNLRVPRVAQPSSTPQPTTPTQVRFYD